MDGMTLKMRKDIGNWFQEKINEIGEVVDFGILLPVILSVLAAATIAMFTVWWFQEEEEKKAKWFGIAKTFLGVFLLALFCSGVVFFLLKS